MAVLGNEEHKQRLNLSSLARHVVEMDRGVLDEGGTLSGFLNRVITQFAEEAEASVDMAVEDRRHQLCQAGVQPELVEPLVDHYRQMLLQKKEAYPQGESLTFRLNNYNFDRLYIQRVEQDNYSAPGKYLKALVEEYARLSPSERERVYYRDFIRDTLQSAIDAGYLLSVSLGQRKFWVKPYKVMADPHNSHLYLVGVSRPEGSPVDQGKIASFRITRLSQVRHRSQPSGKITADERRDIEKKLQSVGVQYLIGEADHIRLSLTAEGTREFMQRSYMRPVPDKIEAGVYHFSCTPQQIRNYFLSFGAWVKILEPESLRQEFMQFYQQARDSYEIV